MSSSNQLIHRAIHLSKAGKKTEARSLLRLLLQENSRNELAWFWYVDTFSTDEERITALEQFIRAMPDSQRGQIALSRLRKQSQSTRPAQKPVRVRKREGSKLPLLFILAAVFCVIGFVAASAYRSYTRQIESLQAQNDVLFDKYVTLSQKYETLTGISISLMGERDQSRESYAHLEDQYNQLQQKYETLLNEYNTLKQNYSNLFNQYNQLVDNYNGLIQDHNLVVSQRDRLQEDYNGLLDEYIYLANTSITPPYIYVYNRQVYLAFVDSDQTIGMWNFPFESLETDIRRGYSARESLLNRMISTVTLENQRTGETYSVMDFRQFVDPTPFSSVIPDLYAQSGSDSAFIHEVWHIVTQLSTYSSEIEETPRYPLETFLAGGGDCEDTAILFASMIKAAPVNWDVELFYMDGDNPYYHMTVNHVIVYLNTGREEHYIETTSSYEMEPYLSTVEGWNFPIQ